MNVYDIPAVNMARLADEVEKMNRRAERLGVPPVTLRTVEVVVAKKRDEILGFEYDYVVHRCAIDGTAPRLQGWTLVAILEPQPNGEMIVREIPGETCPASYRTTGLHCDHCQSKRRRNAIYVLRHDAGGHKQVGKQCLADFLGHADPEGLLSKAEYMCDFAKLAGDAGEEGWGPRSAPVIPLDHFMTMAACVIRRVGYVSRTKANELGGEPTAQTVWWLCTARPDDKEAAAFVRERRIECSDADERLAADAIAWAAAQSADTAASSYLHDLGVCCRQQTVTPKLSGFAASGIVAYRRTLDERAAAPAATAFLGEPGTRATFADLKIVALRAIDGMYPKTLVRFTDPAGNVLVWFASGSPDWLREGDTVTVAASVKGHEEYKGQRQTVLKLVKLIPQAAVA